MKKYFTKYLPVEGAIKTGDVGTNDKEFLKCLSRDKEFIQFETRFGVEDAVNWRKVKLFLCSRDIQVGDKMTRLDGSKFKADKAPDGSAHWSGHAYKVIGELSPEATWVKEGDEFDEDKIQPLWFKKLNNRGGFEWRNKTLQPNNPICYGIKGSCGHFH